MKIKHTIPSFCRGGRNLKGCRTLNGATKDHERGLFDLPSGETWFIDVAPDGTAFTYFAYDKRNTGES